MVEFIAGDPPAGNNQPWREIVEELSDRPGTWAVIKNYTSANAAYAGASHARRQHGLRIRIRKVDGNGWIMYGMYPKEVHEHDAHES